MRVTEGWTCLSGEATCVFVYDVGVCTDETKRNKSEFHGVVNVQ